MRNAAVERQLGTRGRLAEQLSDSGTYTRPKTSEQDNSCIAAGCTATSCTAILLSCSPLLGSTFTARAFHNDLHAVRSKVGHGAPWDGATACACWCATPDGYLTGH